MQDVVVGVFLNLLLSAFVAAVVRAANAGTVVGYQHGAVAAVALFLLDVFSDKMRSKRLGGSKRTQYQTVM